MREHLNLWEVTEGDEDSISGVKTSPGVSYVPGGVTDEEGT